MAYDYIFTVGADASGIAKDIIASYKEAQTYMSGNELLVQFTGDQKSIKEMFDKIKNEKPDAVITFQADKKSMEKLLSSFQNADGFKFDPNKRGIEKSFNEIKSIADKKLKGVDLTKYFSQITDALIDPKKSAKELMAIVDDVYKKIQSLASLPNRGGLEGLKDYQIENILKRIEELEAVQKEIEEVRNRIKKETDLTNNSTKKQANERMNNWYEDKDTSGKKKRAAGKTVDSLGVSSVDAENEALKEYAETVFYLRNQLDKIKDISFLEVKDPGKIKQNLELSKEVVALYQKAVELERQLKGSNVVPKENSLLTGLNGASITSMANKAAQAYENKMLEKLRANEAARVTELQKAISGASDKASEQAAKRAEKTREASDKIIERANSKTGKGKKTGGGSAGSGTGVEGVSVPAAEGAEELENMGKAGQAAGSAVESGVSTASNAVQELSNQLKEAEARLTELKKGVSTKTAFKNNRESAFSSIVEELNQLSDAFSKGGMEAEKAKRFLDLMETLRENGQESKYSKNIQNYDKLLEYEENILEKFDPEGEGDFYGSPLNKIVDSNAIEEQIDLINRLKAELDKLKKEQDGSGIGVGGEQSVNITINKEQVISDIRDVQEAIDNIPESKKITLEVDDEQLKLLKKGQIDYDKVPYLSNPGGNIVDVYRGLHGVFGSSGKNGVSWFTDELELAVQYADSLADDGKIIKANLAMKNPLEIFGNGQAFNALDLSDLSEEFKNEAQKMGFDFKKMITDDVVSVAKSLGYDGVIFRDIKDGFDDLSHNVFTTIDQIQVKNEEVIGSVKKGTGKFELFNQPQANNELFSERAQKDIKQTQDYVKKLISDVPRMDPDGIISKYIFGEGGVKSSQQLIDEIQNQVKTINDTLYQDYLNGRKDIDWTKELEEPFRKLRISQSLGPLNYNDKILPDGIQYLYDQWFRNTPSLTDSLDDDQMSFWGQMIDTQERLNVLQQNGGKDYEAHLERIKQLSDQAKAIMEKTAAIEKTDVDTTTLSQEDATKKADSILKEKEAIDQLIETIEKYKQESKQFSDADSWFGNYFPNTNELKARSEMLEDEADLLKILDIERNKKQAKIYDKAVDYKFKGKHGAPKELEQYYEELGDSFYPRQGLAEFTGEEAIEKLNQKAKELGVTFDETAKKWIQLSSSISSEGSAPSENTLISNRTYQSELKKFASLNKQTFNEPPEFDHEFQRLIERGTELEQIIQEIFSENPGTTLQTVIDTVQKELSELTVEASDFNAILTEIRKGSQKWNFNDLLNDKDGFAKDLNELLEQLIEVRKAGNGDGKEALNLETRIQHMLKAQSKLFDPKYKSVRSYYDDIQSKLSDDTKSLQDELWEAMGNGGDLTSRNNFADLVSGRLGINFSKFISDQDISGLQSLLDILQNIDTIRERISDSGQIAFFEKQAQENVDIAGELKQRLANTPDDEKLDDPEWVENQYKFIAEYLQKAEEYKKKIADIKGELYEMQNFTAESVKSSMAHAESTIQNVVDDLGNVEQQAEESTVAVIDLNNALKDMRSGKTNEVVVNAFRGISEYNSDRKGYWTSSYDEAKVFADEGDDLREIYKAKIKFKKPYYTNNQGRTNNAVRYLGNGSDDISKQLIEQDQIQREALDNIRNMFQKLGFDPDLIYTEDLSKPIEEYFNLSYNPDQIQIILKECKEYLDAYNKARLKIQELFDKSDGKYFQGETDDVSAAVLKSGLFDGEIFDRILDGDSNLSTHYRPINQNQIFDRMILESNKTPASPGATPQILDSEPVKTEAQEIIAQCDSVIAKCDELKAAGGERTTATRSGIRRISEVLSQDGFNPEDISDENLLKLSNAFNTLQNATQNEASEMASGVKDYVSQLLSRFGVEIKNLAGAEFNSLFKTGRFVGEGRSNGNQGIISKQSQPYVFRNNRLLKNPDIILDDGGINEDFIDNVFNEYSHAIETLQNKGLNSEQIAQVLFGEVNTSEVASILSKKLPIDEIISQLIDATGIENADGSFYLNGMKFPPNYDFAKDRREFLSNETPASSSGTSPEPINEATSAISAEGDAAALAAQKKEEFAKANQNVATTASETATTTEQAEEGISAEGNAADISADKKKEFAEANRDVANTAEETAVATEQAQNGVMVEGEAADISADKKEEFAKANQDVTKTAEETAAATENVSEEINSETSQTKNSIWGEDQISQLLNNINEIKDNISSISELFYAFKDSFDVTSAVEGMQSLSKSINEVKQKIESLTSATESLDLEGLGKAFGKEDLINSLSETLAKLEEVRSIFSTGMGLGEEGLNAPINKLVSNLERLASILQIIQAKGKINIDLAEAEIDKINSGSGGSTPPRNPSPPKTPPHTNNPPDDIKKKISEYEKLTKDYLKIQRSIKSWEKSHGGDTSGIEATVKESENMKKQLDKMKNDIESSKNLTDELKKDFDLINDNLSIGLDKLSGKKATKNEFADINIGYETLIKNMEKYISISEKVRNNDRITQSEQNWLNKYDNYYKDAIKSAGLFEDKNDEATESAKRFQEAMVNARAVYAESISNNLSKQIEDINEDKLTVEGSEKLKQLREEYEKIQQTIQGYKGLNISDKVANAGDIEKALSRLRELEEEISVITGRSYQKAHENRVSSLYRKMAQAQYNYSGNKELVESVRNLRAQLDGISAEGLNKVEAEFDDIIAKAAEAGKMSKSFGDTLKKSFQGLARYLMTYTSFYQVINMIKQAVGQVRELDTALMEVRKVSTESLDSLKQWQKTTFNQADLVGTTAQQIQESTASWLRLGKSFTEAQDAAVASNWLLNVSEFQNIDDATTALMSITQAFNDLSFENVIDSLNAVGDHYSSATDQLASGLQNAAAVLKVQGNDINKSLALLTAGELLPESMETYFMYIFNCVERLKAYSTITERLRYDSLIMYVYYGQFAAKYPNVTHRLCVISLG